MTIREKLATLSLFFYGTLRCFFAMLCAGLTAKDAALKLNQYRGAKEKTN